MKNPYRELPERAFWRPAIAEKHPLDISSLWTPKHELSPTDAVATAGSCFAQHIGRALVRRGYNWFDAEPAPKQFDEQTMKDFNYGVFSFRTGNIYTAAALRQWIHWALEQEAPPAELWEKKGRYFDPFRPNIEPNGFSSENELKASRKSVLHAIRKVIMEADFFVFTLGLTESWVNRDHGHTYAMCPGTLAGRFDPELHVFQNNRFQEIEQCLQGCFDTMRSVNPNLRFILTVSPVPLTATASGEHVLAATTYSKSVLRAVAGQLCEERADVDYFPSYEIITGTPFRSMFYESNLRSVSHHGVDFVIDSFFACMESTFGARQTHKPDPSASSSTKTDQKKTQETICEEEMLDAFASTPK
jgi:hypothetical protein